MKRHFLVAEINTKFYLLKALFPVVIEPQLNGLHVFISNEIAVYAKINDYLERSSEVS